MFERGVNALGCVPESSSYADLLIRLYEYVTSVDHLLWGPFESLDSIWNSATMNGVMVLLDCLGGATIEGGQTSPF